MITNSPIQVTALDEARLIIFNQDNKLHLQQIKINSMQQENEAILQDNFMLYEFLVRELSQKFSSEHIVELINMNKFSCQDKINELLDSKNKAKFLERQRDIYQKAFNLADIEDKEKLLAQAEEEYDKTHV